MRYINVTSFLVQCKYDSCGAQIWCEFCMIHKVVYVFKKRIVTQMKSEFYVNLKIASYEDVMKSLSW